MASFFTPRARLQFAGWITVAGWLQLAVLSQGCGSLLGWTLAVIALGWAGFALAIAAASPRDAKTILIFGLGFRVIAFFATPVMEDDHHRFLWDGYRFAVTGDPYAEAPAARFADETIRPEFRAVLDRINHPDVPTVYGPLTEWAFRWSHAIAPAQLWPWKLILLGAELALIAMLWPGLGARGRVVLLWCPLTIFETGFNAHPDALALALVVATWRFGRNSRPLAAGAAAGLAVTAKVFALLVLPFLLWRQGRRAWAMAAAAVVAMYAPFWLHGSGADLAGLRAMAGEWEFNSSVFAVVAALTSRDAAQIACAGAFGVAWLVLFAAWARRQTSPLTLPPGDWIYGGFLLLSATANPWYCLWLWPFVAVRISATGLCALAAVSLAYITGLNLGDPSLGNFNHPIWLRPVEFALIAAGALWDWQKSKTRS